MVYLSINCNMKVGIMWWEDFTCWVILRLEER